jgi:hypothetical protein
MRIESSRRQQRALLTSAAAMFVAACLWIAPEAGRAASLSGGASASAPIAATALRSSATPPASMTGALSAQRTGATVTRAIELASADRPNPLWNLNASGGDRDTSQ